MRFLSTPRPTFATFWETDIGRSANHQHEGRWASMFSHMIGPCGETNPISTVGSQACCPRHTIDSRRRTERRHVKVNTVWCKQLVVHRQQAKQAGPRGLSPITLHRMIRESGATHSGKCLHLDCKSRIFVTPESPPRIRREERRNRTPPVKV